MKNKPSHVLYLTICLIIFFSTAHLFNQRSHFNAGATASTSLTFSPSSSLGTPIQKKIGEPVALDIMIDPGKNAVSILTMKITYDPAVFEATGKETLRINTAALPAIIDGPVINTNSGTIAVTLSVGADPNRAVKTPTKIGTINLKTLTSAGNVATSIAIDISSKAYSVAPADHAFENVLLTASQAFLTVGSPPTPNPSDNNTTPGTNQDITKTPLPTVKPTAPVPTSTPSAPTPAPGANDTVLILSALLHGIGTSGDSANPNSAFSNKAPIHPHREFGVNVYNASNVLVASKKIALDYNKAAGNFIGTMNLGNTVATGNYTFKLKTDSYLIHRIPGIWPIVAHKQTKIPYKTTFIAGDINGDNIENVFDYNALMTCYSDIAPASKHCSEKIKKLADINDDGRINQNDYSILIREISVQNGD